jgi:hypothetical protein
LEKKVSKIEILRGAADVQTAGENVFFPTLCMHFYGII